MKNLLTFAEFSALSAAAPATLATAEEAFAEAEESSESAFKPILAETEKPSTQPETVTTSVKTPEPATKLEYYTDVLIALIPSPIIGAYIVIDGLLKSGGTQGHVLNITQLIVVLGLLIATPLYLRFASKVDNKKQLIVSTIAFAVWIFAIGSPFGIFESKPFLHLIGSIILVFFTLFTVIFAEQIAKK